MVYLSPHHLASALRPSTHRRSPLTSASSVIILVSPDVDALCAARMLADLFQQNDVMQMRCYCRIHIHHILAHTVHPEQLEAGLRVEPQPETWRIRHIKLPIGRDWLVQKQLAKAGQHRLPVRAVVDVLAWRTCHHLQRVWLGRSTHQREYAAETSGSGTSTGRIHEDTEEMVSFMPGKSHGSDGQPGCRKQRLVRRLGGVRSDLPATSRPAVCS
jgi:hypothetical protein